MIDAVVNKHLWEIKGADAGKAGGVDAKFVGIRAALVVRIDPAGLAEVVLRRLCAELVKGQVVLALKECDPVQRCRHGNGAAHPAK